MLIYLKTILLILTILGYSLFMNKKWGIRWEFGPAIVCGGVVVVLFFGGILNMMLPLVYGITLCGLGLLLYETVKTRARIFGSARDFIICGVWLAALMYFAILLRGAHFTHYDNFSHWAVVIKSMLLDNRMPNFQDAIVDFQAYPLGSALFIYYCCSLLGNADPCYIFAQVIMTVSFILPITAFVKKKNLLLGVTVPLFAVIALVCNISIYNLLVDTLLPLVGLTLFCIIEADVVEEKADRISLTIGILSLLSVFLMQVKNSGIFFYVIPWVYFLIKAKPLHCLKEKAVLRFTAAGILLPLASSYLWKRHVDLVYAKGEMSKHAMSLANYRSILGEKTGTDVQNIALQLGKRITDPHSATLVFIGTITVLFADLIVYRLVRKNKADAKTLLWDLGSVYGILLLYLGSVFGMYVFSMPLAEAGILAGFDRYMLTIDIFLLGVSISFLLKSCRDGLNVVVSALLVLCTVPLLLQYKRELPILVKRDNFEASRRYAFQQTLLANEVPSASSYLIYNSVDDSGYLYYLSRYELWSDDVTIATEKNFAECLQSIDAYEYVIIESPDEASQNDLRDAGLEQYATGSAIAFDTASIAQGS